MQKECHEKENVSFEIDVTKVFNPGIGKLAIGEEKIGFQKLSRKAKKIEKCEKESEKEIEKLDFIAREEDIKSL